MASIDREREANTSFEEIAGVMRYNPKTGEFRRKDRPNAKVGSFNQKGRLRITVNGKKFLASRLAWLLYYGEWPAQTVDHIDGDRANNCIANLRLATLTEQQCNRGLPENNTSGVKGASFNKRRSAAGLAPWETYITIYGSRAHLGFFVDLESAKAVRLRAEAAHHGDFARQEVLMPNLLSGVSL